MPERDGQGSAGEQTADAASAAEVVTARFAIALQRCLDPAGVPVGPLPEVAADRDALVAMYRGMVLTRTFDAKAIALQRTGRLGTYASSLGQEAVAVGLAAAMAADDVLLPSFREHGAQLWRGVTPEELFLYWGGDERGSAYRAPEAAADWPICIPVASHAPHAAGVAWALQLEARLQGRGGRAALCVLGDAATSKGDFYEALNLAGVWRLPLVFVVANNRWGISVPVERQTAAQTLAQKAVAAGLPGLQVDGNDALAVRTAVAAALQRARDGGGATLVEALTYRLADHTTADDASRYRDPDIVAAQWKAEPLVRLRAFLVDRFGWGRAEEEALLAAARDRIEAAAAAYEKMAPQAPASAFDSLYAQLPAGLAAERAEVAGHGPE